MEDDLLGGDDVLAEEVGEGVVVEGDVAVVVLHVVRSHQGVCVLVPSVSVIVTAIRREERCLGIKKGLWRVMGRGERGEGRGERGEGRGERTYLRRKAFRP